MTTSAGEQFAQALAAKDGARMKDLLAPSVDFRAMTPGRFWEGSEAAAIVDDTILGTWFAPDRVITGLVSVETDTVAAVDRVGYRLAVRRPDGEFTVEQQAYYATEDGRISWLRIMCTGFLPADVPASAARA